MNNKREKLESLKAALQKGEENLRRAEREVKLLEEKRKAMTRKERTHRLCTHGAMLDRFLLEPDLLTEEDVLMVLKEAFSKEGVRQKLEEILFRRREEISRTL